MRPITYMINILIKYLSIKQKNNMMFKHDHNEKLFFIQSNNNIMTLQMLD